jgi:hypothetical protein
MFECWAYINKEWINGWDCGTRKSTNAIVFHPDYDMTQTYYIAQEDVFYGKSPPGVCVECYNTPEVGHKMSCEQRYKEKLNG